MDANNGNIEWERSAIGFVGDAFVTERKEGANVALVIDSTDVQKTRIAE